MLFALLFAFINTVFNAVLGTLGTFLALVSPFQIGSYWYAVDSIFTGIRALDVFLPISELIVLAFVGIALNFSLAVIVHGWGIGRLLLSLILFWKR